jgi:thiol-disulfide isomerase/thioredoxin
MRYLNVMKASKFILVFLIIPVFLFGEKKDFEISGNITGEYKDKIYVFFDNDFSHKDSTFATIKNGKFHFKLNATLPTLCRFHFGEKTNVQELYIDNSKTFISLSGTLTEKDTPDSLGGARAHFDVVNISGSKMQDLIESFKTWESELAKSNLSDGQKNSKYFEKLQSIVIRYPKSKASAYLIVGRGYLLGKAFMYMGQSHLHAEQVNELCNLLDPTLRHTYEWQNILMLQSTLDKEINKQIGNSFYDVILKDTANNNVDTKSFRKKYVLVNFWASWCTPCRALNPELRALYDKYKEKGFEIVGVSLDENKSSWVKAIKQDNLRWPQLIDENSFSGLLPKYYDIRGIPVKILLNREGKLVGFYSSVTEIEDVLKKGL